jgi:uncharacterized protein (TIGR03382 family)
MLRLLMVVVGLGIASPAAAVCDALGTALTEHSCFHTSNGPFAAVTAVAGRALATASPNVNAVHTQYRVSVPAPDGDNVVAWTPQRSGSWVVFAEPAVPIDIVNGAVTLPVTRAWADNGCAALGAGQMVDVVAGERLLLVLGPVPRGVVHLVIEKLDDFEIDNGADVDGDGFGNPVDVVRSACAPPAGFVANNDDCDDNDSAINPDAAERCNGLDDDCRDGIDNGFDVGGTCAVGIGSCARHGQWQCADNAAVCVAEAGAPAIEICNGVDDDCDDVADEGGAGLCADLDAPACVERDGVTACGCLTDNDCGAADSGRVCDDTIGRCVDGCSDAVGRNGCDDGLFCSSVDAAVIGACGTVCAVDAQCAERSAVSGVCATAALPAAVDGCVQCLTDDACAAQPDGKVACIGVDHTCAACTTTDRARCDPYGDGTACVIDQRCGCINDLDCSHDRVCNLEVQRCEPCPRWLAIARAFAPTDAPTESHTSAASSGCAAAPSSSTPAMPLLLLTIALGIWRRPPQRWSVAVVMSAMWLASCTPDVELQQTCSCRDDETCVDDTCLANCSTSETCTSSEMCHPEFGFCVEVGSDRCACTPVLASPLLNHACQHGAEGPFIDVRGASTPANAPDVDELQHAYRVQLVAGAETWVTYTPTRLAEHAVLSGPGQRVRVLIDDVELVPLHAQSLSCAAFDRVDVYAFTESVTVRFVFAPSTASIATLFVEHLGTFAEPWAITCAAPLTITSVSQSTTCHEKL